MKRVVIALLCVPLYATETEDIFQKKPAFTYEIGGYLKQESYIDIRQIVSKNNGHRLLYPKPRDPDILGNDINAKALLAMNTIQTRFFALLKGPDVGKTKSKAFIETDFLGTAEVVNILRLRHAFLDLSWTNNEFLAGQTWHPLTIEQCYPRTVSDNDGIPIEPFARDPQLRYTHFWGPCSIVLTASSQLTAPSWGPIGPSDSYIRNSLMPEFNIKFEYSDTHFFGASFDILRMWPRLVTDKDFKAHESLMSYAAIVYTTLRFKPLEMRMKLSYVENGSGMDMIGGYAVHSINPVTDHRTYTNIRNLSAWATFELQWSVQPGIFIGYVKNLGAPNSVIPFDSEGNSLIYTRDPLIDSVMRISPRISWNLGPLQVAGELEWTRTGFGQLTCNGAVTCARNVSNVRTMLALFYYF